MPLISSRVSSIAVLLLQVPLIPALPSVVSALSAHPDNPSIAAPALTCLLAAVSEDSVRHAYHGTQFAGSVFLCSPDVCNREKLSSTPLPFAAP